MKSTKVLAFSLASCASLWGCASIVHHDAQPQNPPAQMAAATTPQAPSIPAPPPEAPPPPMRKKGESAFTGMTLFVDHEHRVQKLADTIHASKPAESAALAKIAAQPAADWLGEWTSNVELMAHVRTVKANEKGAMPVFVVYNIPNRDCGQYSKGGLAGPDAYTKWIHSIAKGIGAGRAAVVLEPDALGLLDKCLSPKDQEARLSLLRGAVQALEANGNTGVYLDAGNPHWMPADQMAKRLKAAGVDQADGFALNVSNYMTTRENIAYGRAISALVGGKHFVIDTSRNGNGPTADFDWCNPHGRAIGKRPTGETGEALVDAYLWIKRPGESDGECKGAPKAGEFWQDMAVELVNNAKD
jgi:endoglucanase